MSLLRDRLSSGDAEPRLRANNQTVAEVVGQLESSATLTSLAAQSSLQPVDIIAALAWSALATDLSLGPGLVQRAPARPRLSQAFSETALATALQPLQFDPGTRWSYSNPGLDTLGRVIEVVSGTSYEDRIHKEVRVTASENNRLRRRGEEDLDRINRIREINRILGDLAFL